MFELLGTQPEIVRLRTELNPPGRLHVYGSHITIYETAETGIAVIPVLHQRQDIFALLGE